MKFSKKKFVVALILLTALLTPVLAAAGERGNTPGNSPPPNEIRVLLNGNPVAFDVAPQIIGGRTMVPMRAIFEALGAEVEWHQETSSVTAVTADGAVIRLTIGMDTIYVNDIADTMDAVPQIIEGRTFVPARFVAQAVGASVDWDGDNREVIINS